MHPIQTTGVGAFGGPPLWEYVVYGGTLLALLMLICWGIAQEGRGRGAGRRR